MEAFRSEVRAWLKRELPGVRELAPTGRRPTEDDELAVRRRFDVALWAGGWAGISWPKQYGGRGGTLTEQAIFFEECARLNAPGLFNRVAIGIVGPALMWHGSEDQKSSHLPAILACREVWCQGFSEPDAGSDLGSLTTKAKREHDGWCVSGQKTWSTLGSHADYCFLLARTGRPEDRHRAITAFIVPMGAEGVSVRPIQQINGSREFSEILFHEVLIPEDNVVGGIGDGWKVAMTALTYERSTNFVERQIRLWLQAEYLFNQAMRMPALDKRLENRLLDIYVKAEALRCTVWANLGEYDRGVHPGTESNASKVFWSETYQELCDVALEIVGLDAFRDQADPDSHDWLDSYLAARASTIYAGTSEIQRNIIAERALGLPR